MNNAHTPQNNESSQLQEALQKCTELADQVAELETLNDDLTFKLNRIKNNPLWKISAPFRKAGHFLARQYTRVRNTGSFRGFVAKIRAKRHEKKAMRQHGRASFPDTETAKRQAATKFPRPVKVSILVPLYNTPPRYLREMITSVIEQTYGNWELCLADGSDAAQGDSVARICAGFQAQDSRILYKKLEKNLGIAGNTNQCLELASGDYLGLLDHDDILHPAALYEYVQAINEKEADYLYCDEATFKHGNIDKMITLHFKPDFAIDNLRANNYICHFSVFSRELVGEGELMRPKCDGAQDHDLILRLVARAAHIVHIPKILYYWRSSRASTAADIGAKPYAVAAAKRAVADHLRAQGFAGFRISSTRAFELIFKIAYQIIGTPKITIVIANKDHHEDLRRLIDSILAKTTYSNYEIIIVENNSKNAETWAYYQEIAIHPKIRVREYPQKGKAFNFSAVNNYGVAHADGGYILLLNNDTEVIRINWLEEMLMYAQRGDVGAVGGKLYYPDWTIQHAGVVLGLGAHRTAGHTHYKQHRENLGYMGRLCYAQNVSAVTGACLMVKKSLYEAVGGLDEAFAVSLNDVDFCLKLRAKGYLNVFTPFAELYHYESASRGPDDKGESAARYNEESERFRAKWAETLAAGDPYYNVNFSLDRSDFALKV
ncbi:MAG: glycosyltransferase family 2 protein [Lachnospiraceae bacterium]|jgi:GT2 family glycosyltransferase|nr:glycosyltransferase family 2 protein [Lachnospiraceae bacterium]